MKLSDLTSHDELRAKRRESDPGYAVEADRHQLADEVSLAVVAYRAKHELTQTQLATRLGWRQPQIARLERGDVTPSFDTLQRLARASILEVHVDRTGTAVCPATSTIVNVREPHPHNPQATETKVAATRKTVAEKNIAARTTVADATGTPIKKRVTRAAGHKKTGAAGSGSAGE